MQTAFNLSALCGVVAQSLSRVCNWLDRDFAFVSDVNGFRTSYGETLFSLLACVAFWVLLIVPVSKAVACVLVAFLTVYAMTEGRRLFNDGKN